MLLNKPPDDTVIRHKPPDDTVIRAQSTSTIIFK